MQATAVAALILLWICLLMPSSTGAWVGSGAPPRDPDDAEEAEYQKQMIEWRRSSRCKIDQSKHKEALGIVQSTRVLVEQQERERTHRASHSAGTGQDKVAVLFRSHSPSPSALSRLLRWTKILNRYSRYQIHMSMDVSNGLGPYRVAYRTLRPFGVLFHKYTSANLTATFPVLLSIEPRIPLFVRTRETISAAYPKYFHIEAICLWWKYIHSDIDERDRESYTHAWVFEDDVGITGGSIADLVELYDGKLDDRGAIASSSPAVTDKLDTNTALQRKSHRADLITWTRTFSTDHTNDTAPTEERWIFHETVSDLYAALIPETVQVFTQVGQTLARDTIRGCSLPITVLRHQAAQITLVVPPSFLLPILTFYRLSPLLGTRPALQFALSVSTASAILARHCSEL
jgi:hypothetical protein